MPPAQPKTRSVRRPDPRDVDRSADLPHERDEQTHGRQVEAEPQPVIRQAKRDLDAGLVDTDLRSTPGADAEQRERLMDREARRGKRR